MVLISQLSTACHAHTHAHYTHTRTHTQTHTHTHTSRALCTSNILNRFNTITATAGHPSVSAALLVLFLSINHFRKKINPTVNKPTPIDRPRCCVASLAEVAGVHRLLGRRVEGDEDREGRGLRGSLHVVPPEGRSVQHVARPQLRVPRRRLGEARVP